MGMSAHIQVTVCQAHSQQSSVGRDGHAEDGPRVLCGMGHFEAVQLVHLQRMLSLIQVLPRQKLPLSSVGDMAMLSRRPICSRDMPCITAFMRVQLTRGTAFLSLRDEASKVRQPSRKQ